MRKNSLTPNNGLSLSQAQSISNLCYQRAREIDSNLNGINNFSKSAVINGVGHNLLIGKKIPENIVSLLNEKAVLHACQAFLMENIKAKDSMLKEAKISVADISEVKLPEYPKMVEPTLHSYVDENFGWEQLTISEINEFTESEAYAAHIGGFIHKNGLLDCLRNEISTIPAIDWITIKDGEKTPVDIHVHHTSEGLLTIHEELAGIHRTHEQRVNYFKAKVKNLTTEENARIAKKNAEAQIIAEKQNKENFSRYQVENTSALERIKSIKTEFENERQESIKQIAIMRINIDSRFQETINMFLSKISNTQE